MSGRFTSVIMLISSLRIVVGRLRRPQLSRCRWAILLIGCCASFAQSAATQSKGGATPWIDVADRRYVARFRDLLLSESRRDLEAGWALAQDLGRPVAPLLWDQAGRERSNVGKRLSLLIAALLAGGVASDERLLDFLSRQRPLLQERTMASLWLALGPRRARPRPGIVKRLLGPNKEPEDLLALAVWLAASRFPGSVGDVTPVDTGDPGMLAGAVFAGISAARSATQRHWRGAHRHSDLFIRGALLGQGWRLNLLGDEPDLLGRATRLIRTDSGASSEVRAASVLLLARTGRLETEIQQMGWQDLQVAASQSACRAALASRLRPTAMARDPEPGKLAAAYASWTPVSRVLRESAAWSADPRIRHHIAVALAARLCAATSGDPIDLVLPAVPEWSLVLWASGAPGVDLGEPADGRLASLVKLALQGRAARAAVGRELEQTLWRWGSHPGLAPWQLERGLVRDLLLVGSREGGRYQPELDAHLRYSPTGLDRDDSFFDLAAALYDFTGRRRRSVPEEYRLY